MVMIAATTYYLVEIGIAESKGGEVDMKQIYLYNRNINTLTDSLIFYALSAAFLVKGIAI